MCDEFQYEDSFTALAAMALRLNVSVGTMVTFPHRFSKQGKGRFWPDVAATVQRIWIRRPTH
jgi:hypothetical protein